MFLMMSCFQFLSEKMTFFERGKAIMATVSNENKEKKQVTTFLCKLWSLGMVTIFFSIGRFCGIFNFKISVSREQF